MRRCSSTGWNRRRLLPACAVRLSAAAMPFRSAWMGCLSPPGAPQALDLIRTPLHAAGRCRSVEEPTYFLARASLPTTVCARAAHRHRWQRAGHRRAGDGAGRRTAGLLYTIPTHQNPAGFTLPLERRQRLVDLSMQHGFLIIADEVYHPLSHGEAPPAPLAAFAERGTVLGLGSFSLSWRRAAAGWVQAAAAHGASPYTAGLLDSGGGLNPSPRRWCAVVGEGWQDSYLDMLHATYRRRITALHAS